MKILYLTPGCFDKGGISRYSRYQITALRSIVGAANVRVFSFLAPTPSGFEHPFEVDWHARGMSRLDKAEFLLHVSARAAREPPDVIFVAHVNMSGPACLLARATGAATVLNCYGLEVWSGLRRDAEWGLRQSDYVISDCHFTANYLEANALREAKAGSVIWDCVDLDRFSPGTASPKVLAKYRIPDPTTGINLLSLGRLRFNAAHKGYERLFEVFSRVATSIPNLRLIYAGHGELEGVLQARARAAGLQDRVHFTGAIHEDDLADVYRSAHFFSLVSDRGVGRGEGIPLTPLESAACGVPVLVGDQDGSREAAIDGEGGFVLDPFDLAKHADKVSLLATRPDERERMGRAAHARAEKEFSYHGFVEQHRRFLASRFASARVLEHSSAPGVNDSGP